jgi:hypothetical protein
MSTTARIWMPSVGVSAPLSRRSSAPYVDGVERIARHGWAVVRAGARVIGAQPNEVGAPLHQMLATASSETDHTIEPRPSSPCRASRSKLAKSGYAKLSLNTWKSTASQDLRSDVHRQPRTLPPRIVIRSRSAPMTQRAERLDQSIHESGADVVSVNRIVLEVVP